MSVYIKDMDMPTDCLACRIACDKENYGVIGRPPKCPLAEAAAGDLISRADAIEVVAKEDCCGWIECKADKIYGSLNALPSADAVSREDYHNLLTASNDIDRALREYQAKEEQLSAEVEPKIDHDRDWIIGCIEHDGFIHTHRFDKANQIILDALSAEAVQGEWTNEDGKPITDKFSVYCSRCKEWSEYRTNYCGHCGAKMYKGGDDTTGESL